MGARPIRVHVDGAPYQRSDRVRVVASVETAGAGIDVIEFIGRIGIVDYLEYSCGCGQAFPDDPMIGVRFDDGSLQEFWRDELARETLQ